MEFDPVPGGPRAYRVQLRRVGPFVALVPPLVLGLVSMVLVHHNHSASRGLLSLLFAVLAAPMLLVFGVPLSHGGGTYLSSILASAAVWLAIGFVASFRATRRPVATWRDFWHEYAWLGAGLWVGCGGALLAADLMLGRSLI